MANVGDDDYADEQVRRAEQMALAVASTPNLRAFEAKEMLTKTSREARKMSTKTHDDGIVTGPASTNNNENRNRLNSDSSVDEEVRRARELAMAVAALGSQKGSRMKAEDIRMAVADMCVDAKKTRETIKVKEQEQQQQLGNESSPRKQANDKQNATLEADKGINDNIHTNTSKIIMDDLLRPPWILKNLKLLAAVALANLTILYVTLSSEPSYTKFCNAVFTFNSAVSFFCVLEKLDQEQTSIDSAPENKNRTNDMDDENSTELYQEDLVDEMTKRLRPKKNINLEWLPDVPYSDADLQSLLDLQPESTLAERRRFLKARKGVVKAASAQLGSYIQWRTQNKINEFFPSTFTTDEEDWALAVRGALEIANTGTTPASQTKFPRIVSVYGGDDEDLVLCKNGARVVHVLPSQLNTDLAPATTYALALAMYLDRKLDRNHTEKVTVVIDIRSGTGWPNPSSIALVPFIKLVVGSLNSYFPERLSRCILFPLPMAATVIFNRAKAYLDPDTATKIQVCAGVGSEDSAVPEKVRTFIDAESINIMERRRRLFFVP